MSIIVPKIPQQNGLLIGIQANMPHQVVTTLQTHVSNVEKPSNEQEGTFELKQSLNDFNENNPFEFMGDVFNTGFTEDILSQVITTVPVILQPYALPSTLSTPTLNTEQVTPVESQLKSSTNNNTTESFTDPEYLPKPPTMSLEMQVELKQTVEAFARRNNSSTNVNGLNGKLQEIDSDVELKKSVHITFNHLIERGLVFYEDSPFGVCTGGLKAKKELLDIIHSLKEKNCLGKISSYITDNILQSGMLHVLNFKEDPTVLLHGIQNHLVVVSKINEYHSIVFGFLTSSKDAEMIYLSENQPISKTINKPQMFQPIELLLVSHEFFEINKKATEYVNQEEIQLVLIESFKKKIVNNDNVYEYNPQGITANMLAQVYEKKQHILFEEYKKEFETYQKKVFQKQKQLSAEEFQLWKEKQDTNISKVKKIKWPNDAIIFMEEYKNKNENN